MVNEAAAEVTKDRPDRFGFFATLTLPDVEGAIAEAVYAFETLHADGVVLLANTAGTYLGNPIFDPLLAELDRRAAVIFVHPSDLPGPSVPGIPAFAADFLLDTSRAAISLAMSGAMMRFPNLKIILAHAGGFIPYAAYRIAPSLSPDHSLDAGMAARQKFYFDVALRHAGIDAHVYECAQKLTKVGGAVVIRQPSVRLFEEWGIIDTFYDEAVQIKLIEVHDSSGKPEGTTPADMTGEGNAYSVHRADVHALLLAGVDPQHLHLGLESAEAFEEGDHGVVRFTDERQVRAKLVVGADGIKSVTRKFIHDDELIFAKLVVLRGLAPSTALPEDTPNDRMYTWGHGARMMMLLPLRSGKEVAMDTAMSQDTPPKDLWTSEVPVSELLDFFQGFDPDILKLIEAGTVPVRANPVYEREPIEIWSTAHITLLGDAAHAMAHRAGQGANQAIQDAGALARILSEVRLENVSEALRCYQEERWPITKKMQIASRSAPKYDPLPDQT